MIESIIGLSLVLDFAGPIPRMQNDSFYEDTVPPMSLARFLNATGAAPVTAYRWEKRGWLRTVRIAGRKYITARDLKEFNRRLEAGEFTGQTQNPGAKRKQAR
jgi:hypothetical protein